MIHAHEDALSRVDNFYRDIIFMCLYKDLSGKIENLDTRILKHAYVFAGETVSIQGGHGILFFLKSLDLALRLGYKLGTVCGYEQDK